MIPYIRFTIKVDCDDPEPSRIIPGIYGEIFDPPGGPNNPDKETKIGAIQAFLILRGRAMNTGESLFDAMDSISSSTMECYEALFRAPTDEWNKTVDALYEGDVTGSDVLFIDTIEMHAPFRGKGIGAQVVRGTIDTFASGCVLVVCKPFPLQYSNWEDEEHRAFRQRPDFEKKRLADFEKVAKFWRSLGFRKLPDSEFYAYAPGLLGQPDPVSMTVPSRAPRGRRRRASSG